MSTIHFLNVGDGDCSIIQHDSGRVSVIDICNGKRHLSTLAKILSELQITQVPSGNHGMRKLPTEPISYIRNLGVTEIFRFILTHPDMDHMDGFKALCDEIGILNFWDSGVRKAKPDFSNGRYNEEDWDHYVRVRDKLTNVTVVTPRAGSRFQFANQGYPENRGDCLYIVAPNDELVNYANWLGDPNDASYVIVYRTYGGSIIFSGDAHDNTWNYIIDNYRDLVSDCAVLIAPHHGRHSDRSFKFLDAIKPKLTLFGCADSQYLAYNAWNYRHLLHITNNQAGNIILDAINNGIDVYVENKTYAQIYQAFNSYNVLNNCYYIGTIQ